jgi:hypothetical protein
MADDVRVWLAHRVTADGEPELRDLPRGFVARFLADELLEGLINTLEQGYAVPLDVAVLGYSAGEDGNLKLVSMLAGRPHEDRFVPLAELASSPAEFRTQEGDPRKWIAAIPGEGSAPAAAAMAEVYRLVSVWLTGRYNVRPPVVIHCTGGEGINEHYTCAARSLGLLDTAFGPARLLHCGLVPDAEPVLCGSVLELPPRWAALQDVSVELPAEAEGRPARRAVSVNDWSVADAWSAIFDLTSVQDAIAWKEPDAGRFLPGVREFWTQKLGNKPEEWEDAYATDAAGGAAVVADGASSGIYCRIWAAELTKRFLTDRPDTRDSQDFARWIHGLRGEWRTAINYSALNWAKQRKVDETGAAATFLSLEVGPLDEAGNRPWKACAVGDAALLCVRDGRLQSSFPVVAADQFGSAPMLIRSNMGYKTLAVLARGVCRPGDQFLLATDAVAGRLLKSHAQGPGPDWDRFATMEETAWREELDTLRKSHDMVNDDCTLVVLRVAGREAASLPDAPTGTDAVPEAAAAGSVPDHTAAPAVAAESEGGETEDEELDITLELYTDEPGQDQGTTGAANSHSEGDHEEKTRDGSSASPENTV